MNGVFDYTDAISLRNQLSISLLICAIIGRDMSKRNDSTTQARLSPPNWVLP